MTNSDDDEVGVFQKRCACGEVWSIFTWPQHAGECDAFSLDDGEEYGAEVVAGD